MSDSKHGFMRFMTLPPSVWRVSRCEASGFVTVESIVPREDGAATEQYRLPIGFLAACGFEFVDEARLELVPKQILLHVGSLKVETDGMMRADIEIGGNEMKDVSTLQIKFNWKDGMLPVAKVEFLPTLVCPTIAKDADGRSAPSDRVVRS